METCIHGVDRSEVCQACLEASRPEQPVWRLIDELTAESEYKRSSLNHPECTVKREDTYCLSLVHSQDDNKIEEIQELIEQTFGKDEVDPIEVLRAGIDGKLVDGSKDIARYRLFIARDPSGKIQSLYAGGLIEMVDGQGLAHDEAMFMGAYAVTRQESQRRGLVRELYISSMMQAAADAYAENQHLSLIAAETTSGSERVWNAMHRRRVYLETAPNQYSELTYIQPALEFDPETGLPAEGAGEVAEHLMVHFLDGKTDKDRLLAAVDGIYRWCNTYPRTFFRNEKAYEKHRQYLHEIWNECRDFVFGAGRLQLLSAIERERFVKQGRQIVQHTAADRLEHSGRKYSSMQQPYVIPTSDSG
jgi:hypothetical protein